MQKFNFNEDWLFGKQNDEGGKRTITVPHDAMLYEKRSQNAEGGLNIAYFEGCDYVYEKKFPLPELEDGGKVIFEFEGVYKNPQVFINGEKAAERPYGYTNFYVDATPYLKDENTIKVLSFNSDQPNSRWYTGSGIYRPVSMYTLPKNHILLNGLKIKTISFSPAVVEVSLKTNSSGSGKIEILDKDKVVSAQDYTTDGEYKTQIRIEDAKLWSCDSPYLYEVKATFENDTASDTFGVRVVECDAKKGFRINGERVILQGACFHHDNGLLGASGHPFAEERKVRLLKDAGYNSLRSAHNPCSKAVLDACDKLGVLMVDEYADMWYIHKTKYDYSNYLADWWQQDLTDIVDKDYNHASVVMYSIGNEVAETGQKRGIEFTDEMTKFLHSLDDRPVTCGVNIFFNYLYSLGFGVYSDKKAEKAAKAAVKKKTENKKKKQTIGSEFFNQLAGIVGDDFMKFGATLRGSDRKTKEAFAKLDVAGYNYGVWRYKKDVKKYPNRVILGSETFCRDTYRFIEFAKKNPSLIGDFVWSGMDYLGESGIGAWEYDTYAKDFGGTWGWISAGSGRLDLTGLGSGEAAYTKVAYEKLKMAMAVVPVDRAFKKHSPSAWKMTNAKETWTWHGCEGNKTMVEVYVRADKVVLFLNGRKVGAKKAKKDCRFKFKIRYLPGKLSAVAYDKSGLEISRCSLVTAEQFTKLSLLPENKSINMSGLAYIRLKYTDKSGNLKPLSRGDIKVEVENGELLGLGNACSYNEKGYLTDTTDAYYGEALAIIKPLSNGKITVTANSPYNVEKCTVEVL